MWLVHNNVPFDVAFQLNDTYRIAFAIIFSGFHGRKFNWSTMAFEEPS